MRLINLGTLELESFIDPNIPPYVILSHAWGDGEVTFQDVTQLSRDALSRKAGWLKIEGFCRTAWLAGPGSGYDVDYGWVDTCCIDKSSSSELSEAINSMFHWYRRAVACFAYLNDVELLPSVSGGHVDEQLEASRWFERGWTLQELLAPRTLQFFDKNWQYIDSKANLAARISKRTNIDEHVVESGDWLGVNVARRMSWASGRQTTRVEDIAYCLLGIFDVNMPLLYGEGDRAFVRLQEEILKETDDHSIFAWDASLKDAALQSIGVLATHPSQFKDSASIESFPTYGDPIVVTNKGVHLSMPIVNQQAQPSEWLAPLACYFDGDLSKAVAIKLQQSIVDKKHFSRVRSAPVEFPIRTVEMLRSQEVYLMKRDSMVSNDIRVTKCWFKTPTTSFHFAPKLAHPKSQWAKSFATMSFPATSSLVTGAVLMQSAEGLSFATVFILDMPTRTGRIGLAPMPTTGDENYLASLLVRLDEQAASFAKSGAVGLQVGATVFVRAKVYAQVLRGSWIFVVEMSSVPSRTRGNTSPDTGQEFDNWWTDAHQEKG